MGPSYSLRFLLVSVLLLLCFSHGFGEEVEETFEFGDSTVEPEEISRETREMIEVMDYKDPGPNTNPKTGYIFTPPPQS